MKVFQNNIPAFGFQRLPLWMFSTKVHLAFLTASFALLNTFLFRQLGIRVVNDSPRYLEYAANMGTNGFYIDPHNIWYIGYSFFILGVRSVHDSLGAIVLAQYLFSFMGLIAVYFAAGKVTANWLMALATAMLYLVFFEISIYNSYILCESLFVSMNAICLYFLVNWYRGNRQWFYLVPGALVLIYTVSIKPTGIALMGAMLALFIFFLWRRLGSAVLKTAFVGLVAIGFLVLVNRMLATYGMMNDYRLGEIVYGVSGFDQSNFYPLLTVERPEQLYLPGRSYGPLAQIVLFIGHHPLYWSKLFFGKLFYYFAHIRPYWSLWHNVYSVLLLVPLYGFAIKGMISFSPTARIFVLAFICIHALSIGLTTVDWDGRFLLPLLPLLFVLAGKGVKGG
ncbi:hypothetical protein [Negadavirga shengliensis]|uniref:Dolichyl-phosphate-mannose-protein mannosyltransferase n=1 Tax=Negadavirga shengliensis TaxID=1389218 RepID=A0ABV9T5C5_9BACT